MSRIHRVVAIAAPLAAVAALPVLMLRQHRDPLLPLALVALWAVTVAWWASRRRPRAFTAPRPDAPADPVARMLTALRGGLEDDDLDRAIADLRRAS